MQQLSETSLTMRTALEGGGEGFDALGERAAAARGEVQRTEQAIRRLNAADALQNLRDTDRAYSKVVREAQGQQEKTSHYGEFSDAYNQYMEAHPSGYYKQRYSGPRGAYVMRDENFYVYAKNMANIPIPSWEGKEKKAELQATREFWSGVLEELDAMAIDAKSSVEEIGNKVLEFDSAAGSYLSASESRLQEAWQPVLTAYALLETEYGELTQLQRGSAEYIARAKELTEQTTASVYEQAAAYGVVTNRQAQAAQAAADGQREGRFKRVEENGYQGGVSYLESTVRKAEEAGEDVTAAWNNALDELDAAGHLDAMCQMFGDISNLAVECGGDVEEIVRRLYEMRDAAQSISLSDMAEELRRERTSNAAETDSYDDQVGALLSAFGAGGTEGVLAAMEVWNGFDESLQQSVAETYPSLVIALDDANQAAQSLKEGVGELAEGEDALAESSQTAEKRMAALGTELNAAKKSSPAKYFKNTAKAIEELKHGAISVSDAFGTYNKEAETAVKANEEY